MGDRRILRRRASGAIRRVSLVGGGRERAQQEEWHHAGAVPHRTPLASRGEGATYPVGPGWSSPCRGSIIAVASWPPRVASCSLTAARCTLSAAREPSLVLRNLREPALVVLAVEAHQREPAAPAHAVVQRVRLMPAAAERRLLVKPRPLCSSNAAPPCCRPTPPVPVQMWQEASPGPGADVAAMSPSPGADVAAVSPSPGADVAAVSPSPGADVAAVSPSCGADVAGATGNRTGRDSDGTRARTGTRPRAHLPVALLVGRPLRVEP